jgi:pimeloyl-ACP methyl ester carboxylesterase
MLESKLVQIKTVDGLILPGLLYNANKSGKVMIHLHGNGSSSVFYHYDQMQDFANVLNNVDISLLMFNNRGAHYIKKLNVERKNKAAEQKRFGMAYEIIKECVYDIDAAITYLEKMGFKEFYLFGHSTGANKICVYNYYKPDNKISKYILAGGGDDTGLYFNEFGKEKFMRLLKDSKQKIKQGKGEYIICELLPDEIFSYQGFYDIANPDGDYNTFPFLEAMKKTKLSTKPLFRYFNSVKKPTLVVYGENDEYQYGDVPKVMKLLKKQQPNFTYKLIGEADHGFSNQQKELAKAVVKWLNQL